MTKKVLLFSIFLLNLYFVGAQTNLLLEAELADTIYHCSIDNNHTGYSGSGFINFDNEVGSYIAWNITMPGNYTFTIKFKYANGSTDRTMHVYLNNTLVYDNMNFPTSTEWTNWDTLTTSLNLVSGTNTIKLVGSNPDGGPNIDCMLMENSLITINFAPVATADTAIISINQPILIDVLMNDFDMNGDSIYILSVTQPWKGKTEIYNDTLIRYWPETDFMGFDEFSYTIYDGNNEGTGPVTVSVIDIDWSVEFVNMILDQRTPSSYGWAYTVGLLMEGILRVYKRTNESRYLLFVDDWADLHISESGEVDAEFHSLDNMMPGFTLVHLYNETGRAKYKLAVDSIRERYKTYPRTLDSAFWHMESLNNELWQDGLYMCTPFLAAYGESFNDEEECYSEVIRQYKEYVKHLENDQTGLLLHAYDDDGSASWALPPYNRSPHHWGRAMGWAMMGLTEVLDIIPPSFNERDSLVEIYASVLQHLVNYQDDDAGLWYQVVDQGQNPDNWLETSCSVMYTYALRRATQKGILETYYTGPMQFGYSGVLSKVRFGQVEGVEIIDICQGTGVSSDIDYYFNRNRNINDSHGTGSFLIMNELVKYNNLAWRPVTNGINEKMTQDVPEISLYPNPCTHYVSISCSNPGENLALKIISLDGKTVAYHNFTGLSGRKVVSIDISHLANGMYVLEAKTDYGRKILKLIKN